MLKVRPHFAGAGGFSLVEVIIAGFLMMIVILAVIKFNASFSKTNERLTDRADFAQREAVLSPLMENDFKNGGRGLFTDNLPRKYNNEDLPTSVSETERVSIDILNDRAAAAFSSLSPQGFWGVRSVENKSDSLLIEFPTTTTYRIYRAGSEIAAGNLNAAQINFEIGRAGMLPDCAASFYRGSGETRELLARVLNCPAYPLETVSNPESALPVKASGLFTNRIRQSTRAALPLVDALPAANFVVINSNQAEVLIFGAAEDTDPAILQNQAILSANTGLQLAPVRRGVYRPGDVCLLVDFSGGRTAVGTLTDYNSTTHEGVFQALFETGSNRLFGRFSTSPALSETTFPVGAALFKLSAVEYQFRPSDGQLIRRENGGSWTSAALGVDRFQISEINPQVFDVQLNLASETINAGDQPTVKNLRLTFGTSNR